MFVLTRVMLLGNVVIFGWNSRLGLALGGLISSSAIIESKNARNILSISNSLSPDRR